MNTKKVNKILKKYFRKFLEISAESAGGSLDQRLVNGTLGPLEFLNLILSGLLLGLYLVVIGTPVLIGIAVVYFLIICPCRWVKNRCKGVLRIPVPGKG